MVRDLLKQRRTSKTTENMNTGTMNTGRLNDRHSNELRGKRKEERQQLVPPQNRKAENILTFPSG